jgi:hypothetical protein
VGFRRRDADGADRRSRPARLDGVTSTRPSAPPPARAGTARSTTGASRPSTTARSTSTTDDVHDAGCRGDVRVARAAFAAQRRPTR